MKAVILNGVRAEGAASIDAIEQLLVQLLVRAGWEALPVRLRDLRIADCGGCFSCWTSTPGSCRIEDDGRWLTAQVIGSHLAVCLTPLTFGGYSAQLKTALDRLLPLLSPFFRFVGGEVHHQRRYESFPRLLGVAVASDMQGGASKIFTDLVGRNAISFDSPLSGAGTLSGESEQALQRQLELLLEKVGVAA
jgi:multimeric flavodoxin WrbA